MRNSIPVTDNADLAFKNFALTYSTNKDVKWAVKCASDFLDTIQDVDYFETLLALFLAGKYETTVEKLNEDGTWRTEVVKYTMSNI